MCSVNRSVVPKAWIWKMTTGCMQNSPGVATCTEVWAMNCLLMKYSQKIEFFNCYMYRGLCF